MVGSIQTPVISGKWLCNRNALRYVQIHRAGFAVDVTSGLKRRTPVISTRISWDINISSGMGGALLI